MIQMKLNVGTFSWCCQVAKARGHASLSLGYLPSFWPAVALGLPEAEVFSV